MPWNVAVVEVTPVAACVVGDATVVKPASDTAPSVVPVALVATTR